jgi:hypothetical protein
LGIKEYNKMSLTRKELDKVYKDVKSLYRRKNRDEDMNRGIDVLYQALVNYINGEDNCE